MMMFTKFSWEFFYPNKRDLMLPIFLWGKIRNWIPIYVFFKNFFFRIFLGYLLVYKITIMKEFILKELKQALGQLLTEDRIDDFFKFLAQDPKSSTMASAYYTAPVTMNKFIIGDDGIKIPNPMHGKIFKNTLFMFRWADVYKDAVQKINPDYEFGKRSGTYDKVEGFKVTESGKSGLYLPILPTGSNSNYSVLEDGQWMQIDKEQVRKYLPPYRGGSASGVEYRQLIVDRIAMIKSGGNEWVNPHFHFKYLGPGTFSE